MHIYIRQLLLTVFSIILITGLGTTAHAATFTITKTADTNDGTCDADCSLREAIVAANASGDASETIKFDIGGCGGVCTIVPTLGQLPIISGGGITIDGFTQTGSSANTSTFPQPLNPTMAIVIDMDNTANGLRINSSNNTLSGLVINNSTGYGIYVYNDSTNNRIQGSYIGTDETGEVDQGNSTYGVYLNNSHSNFIGSDGDGVDDNAERNLISGNNSRGLYITGDSSTNRVSGNYIGTDKDGASGIPNGSDGILINSSTVGTIIGTNGDGISDEYEGNVISGNNGNGVDARGDVMIFSGNYLGVNAAGTGALSNGKRAIDIKSYDPDLPGTIVGTNGDGISDEYEGNIISGNSWDGLTFNIDHVVIAGNKIGTDKTGSYSIPNGWDGIWITYSSYMRIGTNGDGISDSLERNIISGNTDNGIWFYDVHTSAISGNYFGVDATGNTKLGNNKRGIFVGDTWEDTPVSNLLVGTNGDGISDDIERNVIAGNLVGLTLSNVTNSIFAGNFIGVGADGITPIGNDDWGVELNDMTNDNNSANISGNIIGGDLDIESNIIANNGYLYIDNPENSAYTHGMYVNWATVVGNKFYRNSFYNNAGVAIFLEHNAQDTSDSDL